MKKIMIFAIIAFASFVLSGCSSKNESGVEITKGWFAMNSADANLSR